MSEDLPPLNTLRAFVAAARQQSFSRAAETLNLSQAAVSRQMRILAEDLGTELFKRERYSVRLTEHGRRLLAVAEPLLAELASVAGGIRRDGTSETTFVIYSDPGIMDSVLMPLHSEIKNKWPQFDVQIICSDISVTNSRQPVNLGLQGNLWENNENFEVVTIATDTVFPVCAPDSPLVEKFADGKFNLDGATFLHLEQPGRTWVSWHEFCRHNNKHYPLDCEEIVFTNYPALIDAAARGYGVALVWERTSNRYLVDGKLHRLGDTFFPWPHGICAYLPEPNPHSSTAREIVAWLTEQLSVL